ncbi:hypothetical protein AB0K51_31685 [Kitasatospora sp. NPDC049285]|uniref:hypothetical protein n=1 Tax=Kitasatospora sp. NPDC049285 TaxID=3157096 RepID=UPI0034422BD8
MNGIEAGLTFDGPVLSGIFTGRIARWNDPALIAVRNSHGRSIQPCPATITLGASLQPLPADLRTSFTDGPDTDAYPITGTTYALVRKDQKDPAKAAALVNYLSWVLTAGQDRAPDLHYAPLGPSLQAQSLAKLKTLAVNGSPLFP